MKQDMIVILDLGSTENTVLAREIRELGVYSEIHPHDITEEAASEVANEESVHVADWLGLLEGATYQGKELVVQSSGEELAEQMNLSISEGTYPTAADEAAMDISGLTQYGLLAIQSVLIFPMDKQKNIKSLVLLIIFLHYRARTLTAYNLFAKECTHFQMIYMMNFSI